MRSPFGKKTGPKGSFSGNGGIWRPKGPTFPEWEGQAAKNGKKISKNGKKF
jgi:hypothetical protein